MSVTGIDPGPDSPAAFRLSDDQLALVDTVQAFAARELAPHALQWDRDRHFPLPTIKRSAALGLGGVCVDEGVGGSGLGRLESVCIFEALATGCPTISAYISIHNMVAWMIDRFGDDDQRARLLPGLCAMDQLASYCLSEPDSGSDAASLRTTAILDGDHYVVNGVKQFVSGAGTTDLYLVMARTGGPGAKGITALVIGRDDPGVAFGANEQKMGWHAQPTRQVVLEDVRVPLENRLGPEGSGFSIAMSGLDGGRINIAACSLGGATDALRRATAHLQERHAFGGPLADLQALRFRVADMATELEAARLMVYRAAAAMDAGDPDATRWCAMAKRFATDIGFSVADQSLQLHGGYGYLSEYGIEKIVRDLRVHQILEGTNEIMRVIIARELFEGRG
jgi:alkylation response protein AidB-like acyl-CoA dehydrogenase